jgi:hypothetical protein
MQVRVNHVVVACALIAFASPTPPALAAEGASLGDAQWVPSLGITSGVFVSGQTGNQSSTRIEGEDGSVVDLREPDSGKDTVLAPFVGGAIEIMSPAFFPRVRFFVTGELLPTFAPERLLAQEGQAERIRGPDVGAVLAKQEDEFHYTEGGPGQGTGPRTLALAFGENEANGQGMRTMAQIDQLTWGAKIGISFSFQLRGREMRVKPSIGYMHYKVGAKGYLVDPTCADGPRGSTVCTDTYNPFTLAKTIDVPDFRETILSGKDSGKFDAVGPGVDLEMQTGRLGPLGTALYLGVHAYYQPGDRDIQFSTSKSNYTDSFGDDVDTARWRVRVDPWIYRLGLGFRLQWLGSGA